MLISTALLLIISKRQTMGCNPFWIIIVILMQLYFLFISMYIPGRVANVVADYDDLLTQWRPIKRSKFRANIFLIQATSNYFWASKVLKIRGLKVTYFHFPSTKNIQNWKCELIFMQLSFFINKMKNSHQFSKKYFSKNGP